MDSFIPQKTEGILDNKFKPEDSQRLHEMAAEKKDALEMALELMKEGVPMSDIPIENYEALLKMYNEKVLNMNDISNEENEQFKNLFSSTREKYLKFSNIIDSLHNKKHNDLAEELSFVAEIIIDDQLKTAQYETYDLLDMPMQQNHAIQKETTPEDEEDNDEPIVDVKEIEHLTDKLQSVLDAMGEDLDPELISFAKKIAKEILDAFEILSSEEIPEETENIPSEEIPQENIAPPVPEQIQQNIAAKIMKPTIKLAQISQYLDENNDKRFKDIDSVLDLLYKIIN